jgi:outer membrane protein assembly factor BamD (BamD/ComL family)
MSLAQLELDRNKPKAALRLFRAYRKRGGPLAEDAAYGEIRALRALGRSTEATRAANAFARRYPNSPYGTKLER